MEKLSPIDDICDDCGGPIEPERVELLPDVVYCAVCAHKHRGEFVVPHYSVGPLPVTPQEAFYANYDGHECDNEGDVVFYDYAGKHVKRNGDG